MTRVNRISGPDWLMVQSVLWDPESGNEKSKYDGNSESVLELSKLKCPDSIKIIRSRKSNPVSPRSQDVWRSKPHSVCELYIGMKG